jgi:hypothetical protein
MATQFGHCAGFVTIPGGKLFVHEENPGAVLPVLRDFLLLDRCAHKGSLERVAGSAAHTFGEM